MPVFFRKNFLKKTVVCKTLNLLIAVMLDFKGMQTVDVKKNC